MSKLLLAEVKVKLMR